MPSFGFTSSFGFGDGFGGDPFGSNSFSSFQSFGGSGGGEGSKCCGYLMIINFWTLV